MENLLVFTERQLRIVFKASDIMKISSWIRLVCFKKSGNIKNSLKAIYRTRFKNPVEAVPSLIALFGGIIGVILLVLGIMPTFNGGGVNISLTAPGISMIFVALLLGGFIAVFGSLGKNCKRAP
jgi:hypothetical protein